MMPPRSSMTELLLTLVPLGLVVLIVLVLELGWRP